MALLVVHTTLLEISCTGSILTSAGPLEVVKTSDFQACVSTPPSGTKLLFLLYLIL